MVDKFCTLSTDCICSSVLQLSFLIFSIFFAFAKIHNVIENEAIWLLIQLMPSYLDKNCANGNCISVVVEISLNFVRWPFNR